MKDDDKGPANEERREKDDGYFVRVSVMKYREQRSKVNEKRKRRTVKTVERIKKNGTERRRK